jgi:predicted Fe-S protein YdhL (DUF1289 family)
VSHFCIGCARTIEEIAEWPRLGAEEKHRIMAQLPARFARPQERPAEAGSPPADAGALGAVRQ